MMIRSALQPHLDEIDVSSMRKQMIYTGRSPFTVTRVPERVCGQ